MPFDEILKMLGAMIIMSSLWFLLNLLLFHCLIKRAIKQVIKPYLAAKGKSFLSYKWAGFFNTGNFRNEQMDFAFFSTGIFTISIYSFINYDDSSVTKAVPAKIYIEGLHIDKVTYSNDI